MARFAYDVNTRTRLIDIYKQFNGGLKTVDTDDALGSVYLRQAENVSLSEFGFIEKRYGTFQKELIKTTNGTLQGFWEFEGFSIYAINNIFYYNGTQVTSITQENNDYRYPTLPTYDSSTGFGGTTFRDMNAVNINSVLYIFTGHYPVYVKIDSNTNLPVFYWFSVTIPTYDEVVVTGHNLLEDNYDTAYKYTTAQAGSMTPDATIGGKNKIDSVKFNPSIPFVVDENGNPGSVEFNVDYTLISSLALNYPSLSSQYKRLSLKSVGFRRSGSGATTFTPVDITDVDFEDIDNANDAAVRETLDEGFLINKLDFVSSNLTRTVVQVPNLYMHQYEVDITYNLLKSAMTVGEEAVIQIFKDTGNANNPFDKILLTELNGGPASSSVPSITITPKDSSGTAFTTSAVTISSTDITTTNDHYRFTIPTTLSTNDSIASYDIVFSHDFQDRTVSSGDPFNYAFTDFSHTLAYVKSLSSVRNFSNTVGQRPLVDFSITDLLSGTYDFQITYELKNYTSIDGLFDLHSSETFSGIAYEVPITAEKLQDFPGVTDDFLPKLKPIWSCNKVMEHYGKLMVWGSTEMPTAVFYSFPDRPTYFPSKFYLDFTNGNSQPIEAVTPYMNILVAQTASQTWGIRGNSGLVDAPAPYVPFGINSTVGTIAYKSVRPVRNHLFFLSRQGVIALKSLYAADEQYNIEFVDRNIRNIVPQETGAVGIQFDNQYWLNFPEERITLRWYIDKKAWVQDVYQGYATNGFNGVFKYQIVDGKLEFITHPSTLLGENQNEAIYKIAVDYDLPTDLHQPIKAKFETAFLNQNYPFHPKNYKEAKLDFTLQNEYNKGRLAIFDSSIEGVTTTYAAQSISFTLGEGIKLEKNHRYRVDFFLNESTNSDGDFIYSPVNVTDIQIEGQASYVHSFSNLDSNGNKVIATEFMLTNDEIATTGNIDIEFTHDSASTTNPSTGSYVTLRDVTYDDSLTFDTYVISEDQTLNFDNYSGYDQATVDIGLDLTAKERLGDWTFGTSDFGKKVTAVKTIKLSGKGYNAKLYLEDTSKSKWTLESMGITYKMKRARSR